MHTSPPQPDGTTKTKKACLTCSLQWTSGLCTLRGAGQIQAVCGGSPIASGGHGPIPIASVLPAAPIAAICDIWFAVLPTAAACMRGTKADHYLLLDPRMSSRFSQSTPKSPPKTMEPTHRGAQSLRYQKCVDKTGAVSRRITWHRSSQRCGGANKADAIVILIDSLCARVLPPVSLGWARAIGRPLLERRMILRLHLRLCSLLLRCAPQLCAGLLCQPIALAALCCALQRCHLLHAPNPPR